MLVSCPPKLHAIFLSPIFEIDMSEPALKLPDETSLPPEIPAPRPLNFLVRSLCWLLFRAVKMDPADVERIRSLSERGAVAYVLRMRSWVDCLLTTYVLEREGLPSPSFVNDMRPLWMRPLSAIGRGLWLGFSELRPRSQELRGFADRAECCQLVERGHPILLFLRGRKPRWRFGKRRRLTGFHHGRDYIREIVHHHWQSETDVFFVPLVPLRGRGMRRKESRLATLVYSLQETPSEGRRLASLLWNRSDTSISAGDEVGLRDFVRGYGREGEERTVRRLARKLQIYLYREERVVWGPLLLPKPQVCRLVLDTKDVRETIAQLVADGEGSEAQMQRRASRYIEEMAADFKKSYFSVLEFAFNWMWPRMFSGLDHRGLERVVECVKQHPVVLVPCHRSHFDYIILSYLFHLNYVSPPHIAAGINLSFWPMGPLFRGAGAYFIRRTFEGDDLYKAVFRQYLTFLIREGYTQEFFLEGSRSRTGKILSPKLGVLSAVVEAFARGARRDLYFVPVSIHYGRVAEEDAYQRELGGAEKQKESLGALIQARRVLRRRHGTVYVSFAKPLSLSEALGDQRQEFAGDDEAAETERRRFVQKLGLRLVREINRASIVGATSVSSTVLLASGADACREHDFVARARSLVAYLRRREIALSASLERNDDAEFRESLSFLEGGNLVRRFDGVDGSVIHVPQEKRLALDFYKNNAIHYLLQPCLLLDAIGRGKVAGEADDDVAWWLDFLRWEFPLPDREALEGELAASREAMRAEGVLIGVDREEVVSDHPFAITMSGVLDNFREAYLVATQVLRTLPEEGEPRKSFLERAKTQHSTALLLGDFEKPEGSSSVIFTNALKRYAELGIVLVGSEKDPVVGRGPAWSEIPEYELRIAASLREQLP